MSVKHEYGQVLLNIIQFCKGALQWESFFSQDLHMPDGYKCIWLQFTTCRKITLYQQENWIIWSSISMEFLDQIHKHAYWSCIWCSRCIHNNRYAWVFKHAYIYMYNVYRFQEVRHMFAWARVITFSLVCSTEARTRTSVALATASCNIGLIISRQSFVLPARE